MSWHGPQGKGAAKQHREVKRAEAEERNALTPLERRRAFRLAQSPVVAANPRAATAGPNPTEEVEKQ